MRAELYTTALPQPGVLSIVARPRGGDWLPDEIAAWRRAGIDVVVSLLTEAEQEELDLTKESELCRQQAMEFVSFPIPDRHTPAPAEAAIAVIETIAQQVRAGKHVAVHCRMGIGRAAMIAACTLVALGHLPYQALALVASARGCSIPDTEQQRAWVLALPSVKRN